MPRSQKRTTPDDDQSSSTSTGSLDTAARLKRMRPVSHAPSVSDQLNEQVLQAKFWKETPRPHNTRIREKQKQAPTPITAAPLTSAAPPQTTSAAAAAAAAEEPPKTAPPPPTVTATTARTRRRRAASDAADDKLPPATIPPLSERCVPGRCANDDDGNRRVCSRTTLRCQRPDDSRRKEFKKPMAREGEPCGPGWCEKSEDGKRKREFICTVPSGGTERVCVKRTSRRKRKTPAS